MSFNDVAGNDFVVVSATVVVGVSVTAAVVGASVDGGEVAGTDAAAADDGGATVEVDAELEDPLSQAANVTPTTAAPATTAPPARKARRVRGPGC